MKKKINRIKIKEAARAGLVGGWLKGAVLIAVSIVLGMFCSNFIPMYAPETQLTAEQLLNLSYTDMLKLLSDMLVPEEITRTYIGRVAVCVMIFVMVMFPFKQGIREFCYRCFLKEKPKARVAFSWYTDLGKVTGAVKLYVYIGILSALWGVLILAVPVAVLIYAGMIGSMLLNIAGTVLYIAATVLYMIKLEAYTPAYYIHALSPDGGVLRAVRNSVYITRGRLKECFVFRWSFILWQIGVLITGNIGQIFFEPYYTTATAGLTEALISYACKDDNQGVAIEF